jgi:hypothetical protein
MFEDILGNPNKPVSRPKLNTIDENTIIVCPQCGKEMMSLIFDDEELSINLVDNDYPCKQCLEELDQIDLFT